MKEEQKGEILIFQSSKSNISEHIKHIIDERELREELVVRKFRTTTKHGAIEEKTSHRQAIEKAKAEFKKHQFKTLSPVEEDYLESIKVLQKEVKKSKDNE